MEADWNCQIASNPWQAVESKRRQTVASMRNHAVSTSTTDYPDWVRIRQAANLERGESC